MRSLVSFVGSLAAATSLDDLGLSRAALTALTDREAEVAVLIVDGLADREIAERLHLSHRTVTQYVNRIYRKLAVDSRVTLTRLLFGGRQ